MGQGSGLGSKAPHEMLVQLAGALAVLLSGVLFGIRFLNGISPSQWDQELTPLVINVVLGSALMIASIVGRSNVFSGAIVAASLALILAIFGGNPGLIAGLVGILGAVLTAASPYLPKK